jgi:hypothetical protein
VRGASGPQATNGNARPRDQSNAGAVKRWLGLLGKRSPQRVRSFAAPATRPPGAPLGAPTSADAPVTAADTQLPGAPLGAPTSADAPVTAADTQLPDTPIQAFLYVVSSVKNTINACILLTVFFGGATYFAEHVHAGLVVNIAKGGFVVSFTAAASLTVAIGVAASRRRRREKKEQHDSGDGPTIQYQG